VPDYGGLIVKPTPPTRIGHTFEGWYRDATLENAWDFSSDWISSDSTLYAKWEKAAENEMGTV